VFGPIKYLDMHKYLDMQPKEKLFFITNEVPF